MNGLDSPAVWLQAALLMTHWSAWVALFAATAGIYVLLASDESDQHKMHQGTALSRLVFWCWLALLISGVGLALPLFPGFFAPASGATLITAMTLKAVLALFAFCCSIYPWRFMKRNAMVRSYRWVNVPSSVRWCLRLQFTLLALVMIVSALIRAGTDSALR